MRTRSNRPIEQDQSALQAAAYPLQPRRKDTNGQYEARVLDLILNESADNQAWYYWGATPELHYLTRYIANALSVVKLYIGTTKGDPKSAPEHVGKRHYANELLANFAGGGVGQSDLLDRLALHLTVTGDSVLIGPKPTGSLPPYPYDQWRVWSTNEVTSRNGQIFVRRIGSRQEDPIPSSAMAVRIWRPHPQFHERADSPVKSSFTVLRELDLLDKHVAASAVSRLAGAGIYWIPDEITFPSEEVETEGVEVDPFVRHLTEVMSLSIKNQGTAAAVVPIIIRAQAEAIAAIRHDTFATAFDERVPELRMTALRRLALGMDVPPEILLGQSESTSWSAWQTDESTLRVHLVPLLTLIASSLTVGWLKPTLDELPLSAAERKEAENLVVWFDYSNLKIRQDVSGDAQALYDRHEIDADALRLATGYSANSQPDNKELARQILLSLVRNNPNLAGYALNALRENFGITDLPEACDFACEAVIGRPPEGDPPATTEPATPLPDDRSQDKQTDPPPLPAIDGDQNNNEVK